jgi:hypothetical protein
MNLLLHGESRSGTIFFFFEEIIHIHPLSQNKNKINHFLLHLRQKSSLPESAPRLCLKLYIGRVRVKSKSRTCLIWKKEDPGFDNGLCTL